MLPILADGCVTEAIKKYLHKIAENSKRRGMCVLLPLTLLEANYSYKGINSELTSSLSSMLLRLTGKFMLYCGVSTRWQAARLERSLSIQRPHSENFAQNGHRPYTDLYCTFKLTLPPAISKAKAGREVRSSQGCQINAR